MLLHSLLLAALTNLLAKQRKYLKKITPVLAGLQEVGYFLSEALVRELLLRAKEKI